MICSHPPIQSGHAPKYSRWDSNPDTPGLSRAAMPFAYGSKAEPERVELSSPLSESRFERGGLASYPKGSRLKARESNSDPSECSVKDWNLRNPEGWMLYRHPQLPLCQRCLCPLSESNRETSCFEQGRYTNSRKGTGNRERTTVVTKDNN